MFETIDIRNKSLATMANMVSDWLLDFYTLHAIIANGFVFPDCSTVSGQSKQSGKATPDPAVEQKRAVIRWAAARASERKSIIPADGSGTGRLRNIKSLASVMAFGVLSHLIETPPPVSAGEPLRRGPSLVKVSIWVSVFRWVVGARWPRNCHGGLGLTGGLRRPEKDAIVCARCEMRV